MTGNLVTRGLGPFGSAAFVVTAGLGDYGGESVVREVLQVYGFVVVITTPVEV